MPEEAVEASVAEGVCHVEVLLRAWNAVQHYDAVFFFIKGLGLRV